MIPLLLIALAATLIYGLGILFWASPEKVVPLSKWHPGTLFMVLFWPIVLFPLFLFLVICGAFVALTRKLRRR